MIILLLSLFYIEAQRNQGTCAGSPDLCLDTALFLSCPVDKY